MSRPILTFSRTLIPKIVGLVLVAAAVAKLAGMGMNAVPGSGWFADVSVQWGVVALEVVLGLWFLSGVERAAAWLAALALFSIFAVVSFRQGWIGESSCGCFGAVNVSPWIAFTIDLAVLGLLAIARPVSDTTGGFAKAARVLAQVCCGVVLIVACLATAGAGAFGSPGAALAFLRGERLSVEPRVLDMGEGQAGEMKEANVEVHNWTDQPIRLIGGTQDCSCTVIGELPVTIPPNASRPVTVRVRLPGKPGIFTRKGGFYVDDGGFGRIAFRLTGRTAPSQDSSILSAKPQ